MTSPVFPDHPRKRASEHFINLSRDSKGLTADACPQSDKCLLTAIKDDASIISSKSERQRDKLLALKFLGHWLGDIHQPLHVSFEDDRGGNDVHVNGECATNMHSAWDTCLVQKAVRDNVPEAAAKLLSVVTPEQIQAWRS